VVAVLAGALTVIGPATPAAASTPVITPRHGLPYFARVTIHAEKWANTEYSVAECFDTPVGEYCTTLLTNFVSNDGIIDASVVVTRRYDLGDGRVLDCADPDAACEIVVDAKPTSSGQRLTFDPAAPVPTLTVTPHAGLGWSGPVSVSGSGFLPHQSLWLTQCARVTSGASTSTPCAGVKHRPNPVVDDQGRFTFTLTARRLASGYYDCVQPDVHCFVRALQPDERYREGPVDAPIAFTDDGVPVVRLDPGRSVSENAGSTHIEVQLTGPATTAFTVSYTTRAAPPDIYDPALPGADYTARTAKVRFLSGETRHVIASPIVDDTARENLEAFAVVISGPFHANNRTHIVFIDDNDF